MQNTIAYRNRHKSDANHKGVTLIELVIAIVILTVLSSGALAFQYYATKMALRAKAEITATRTARLVLDNWKKTGGDSNFKPTSIDSGFTSVSVDKYSITINGIPMTVTISWQDIETDTIARVTLRQIQVKMEWRSDYKSGTIRSNDPAYTMSTYVRRDESGG